MATILVDMFDNDSVRGKFHIANHVSLHAKYFLESHGMNDDTTRYPRSIVSFAIVMLGTGVERYVLPVLL
jgi:hypothetical protein